MAASDLARQRETRGIAPKECIVTMHMTEEHMLNPWKHGTIFSATCNKLFYPCPKCGLWQSTARIHKGVMYIVCRNSRCNTHFAQADDGYDTDPYAAYIQERHLRLLFDPPWKLCVAEKSVPNNGPRMDPGARASLFTVQPVCINKTYS